MHACAGCGQSFLTPASLRRHRLRPSLLRFAANPDLPRLHDARLHPACRIPMQDAAFLDISAHESFPGGERLLGRALPVTPAQVRPRAAPQVAARC